MTGTNEIEDPDEADEPYEIAPGLWVCPDVLRKAVERYFKDGTPYVPVLIKESKRARKALQKVIERRAAIANYEENR